MAEDEETQSLPRDDVFRVVFHQLFRSSIKSQSLVVAIVCFEYFFIIFKFHIVLFILNFFLYKFE
jgi:hypothetical protein